MHTKRKEVERVILRTTSFKKPVNDPVAGQPLRFAKRLFQLLLFMTFFVGYSELPASFSATRRQYLAPAGSFHPRPETMLVSPLAVRWLIRTFHYPILIKFN